NLLSLYPTGNSHADDPLPGVFEAFRFSETSVSKINSTASRVDIKINEKHNLTISHQFNTGFFQGGAFTGLPETFPGFGDAGYSPQRGQLVSINLVSNLNPSVVNSFTLGGNRAYAAFNGAGDTG